MNYTTGQLLTIVGLTLLAISLEVAMLLLVNRAAYRRGYAEGVKAERGRMATLQHPQRFRQRQPETSQGVARVRSVRMRAMRWPRL